jgi:hypothetical protein
LCRNEMYRHGLGRVPEKERQNSTELNQHGGFFATACYNRWICGTIIKNILCNCVSYFEF